MSAKSPELEDTMISPFDGGEQATMTPNEVAAESKRIQALYDSNELWRNPEIEQARKEREQRHKELAATPTYGEREHPKRTDPKVETEYEDSISASNRAHAAGEDYKLTATNSAEKLITMLRAVGLYGEEISDKYGLNPDKLVASKHQLSDVLGTKLGNKGSDIDSIDASTYMVTALSLAHMQEVAPDEAERQLAGEAWNSLRQEESEIAEEAEIISHPEKLKRVKIASVLGPRVGEMAANAVVRHHLENTGDLVTIE